MPKEPEPIRITAAGRSHSDDVWSREKRYMITMGIRTACFLIAVALYLATPLHWLAWVFIGGSLVLPYVAVVMANGASPDPTGSAQYRSPSDDPGHREIG